MNSKTRLEMAGSGGKIEALTVLDAPSNASNRHAELSSEGLVPFYQNPANDPASRASAHGVGDVYTVDHEAKVAAMYGRFDEWMRVGFVGDHVNQAIDAAVLEIREELVQAVIRSIANSPLESPLEAAFLAYWTAASRVYHRPDLDLRCQHEVKTSRGATYRADFLIAPSPNGWYAALLDTGFQGVVVELDGHEFHERTKEQVAQRNQRDRALQADGFPVLHCSGSELHRNGAEVVEALRGDALSIIAARWHSRRLE